MNYIYKTGHFMIKGHCYLDYPLKGDDYSKNCHLKEDILPKASLYNGKNLIILSLFRDSYNGIIKP